MYTLEILPYISSSLSNSDISLSLRLNLHLTLQFTWNTDHGAIAVEIQPPVNTVCMQLMTLNILINNKKPEADQRTTSEVKHPNVPSA